MAELTTERQPRPALSSRRTRNRQSDPGRPVPSLPEMNRATRT